MIISVNFCREEEVFRPMSRKGIYPYNYIDAWEKFEEIKLPPKNVFYSKLNIKGVSDEDYEHA